MWFVRFYSSIVRFKPYTLTMNNKKSLRLISKAFLFYLGKCFHFNPLYYTLNIILYPIFGYISSILLLDNPNLYKFIISIACFLLFYWNNTLTYLYVYLIYYFCANYFLLAYIILNFLIYYRV